MTLSTTEKESLSRLFEVVISFGELKNMKLSPGANSEFDQSSWPPFVMWGFVEDNPAFDSIIWEALKTFDSKVEWCLAYREKWRYLYPKYVSKIEDEKGLVRSDARGWLEENEPEFGRLANKELARFASYLEKKVNEYREGTLQWIKIELPSLE